MTTEKKFNKRRNQGKKKEQTSNSAEKILPENGHSFHIVGIGTSAGGLEALEQFFKNMPHDSGMAFVIVQHLLPDEKKFDAGNSSTLYQDASVFGGGWDEG
jgi:two-component system CheB/CheR fusion protein